MFLSKTCALLDLCNHADCIFNYVIKPLSRPSITVNAIKEKLDTIYIYPVDSRSNEKPSMNYFQSKEINSFIYKFNRKFDKSLDLLPPT